MSQSLEAKIPSESSLVNEELKKNLKMIFERLVRPVCLKAVLDPEQPASVEMGSFLKAVAQLSPWIELQLLERGEDSEADGALDTEHLPSTGLFGENGYLGAAFLGVPGGKEINSFVAAILNAAGPEKELDQKLLKKIAKLKCYPRVRVTFLSPLPECCDSRADPGSSEPQCGMYYGRCKAVSGFSGKVQALESAGDSDRGSDVHGRKEPGRAFSPSPVGREEKIVQK